jgi:hypothetical protein
MSKIISKPIHPLGHNSFVAEETILSVNDYNKNKDVLNTYKVPQLKQLAKFYKIPVSGKKQELFERIETYFQRVGSAIKIQKTFRGYLTRVSFQLRGEGYRQRSLCVNDNDFYSLEPLKEIPAEYFFTFTCGKFVYGCNIISLIHLIKSKPINPYNRETISQEVIKKIIRLYGIIRIVFGLPFDAPVIKMYITQPIRDIVNGQRLIPNELIDNVRDKMRRMELKSIQERIRELFMEIDQLGNYTNSVWFSSLDRRDYIRLFRMLYEIWSSRGQLTHEIKLCICILGDPFRAIYRERVNFQESTIDVLREVCLKIMEFMIYCGIDDEYRKIGALHVLTALTSVSIGARMSLPWLYEALF